MEAQLGALRGESARMVAIRAQVAQLLARQTGARRLPPILILGETGTGKGLVARTIHQAGPRRAGPFVDINCAAIPETLLEAELFGYERGAFTDARQAKPGLFQAAHGGTLFLDEIGLLPVALQSKLLTVLEDRAVRRLGSTRAEPVDVTLVAATSVDLKRAVADGRFREDLYHRLAVITLELPPLRSRGADILTLADHFLARACADYGLSPRTLTPGTRDLLAAYRWPGNVRELANAMERVVLLSETDEIPPAMLGFLTNDAEQTTDAACAVEVRDAHGAGGSLDDALRERIEAGLRGTGGNIRRTAAALGISRNTLRARMDKYGLRHHDAPPTVSRRVPTSPAAAQHPAPTHWERRLLAFLRVRLLPSTTVEASRALEVVGEKVRSFGGRLEESSPTEVIAVFGLEPVDNAPSHAALAALAIQKAAAHARVAGGRSVEIVIAIHCTDLLVGRQQAVTQVGVDGKAATWSVLETLVAGETPGAIVVSDPVVPFLARRFALERLRDTTWLLLRREEPSAGWSVTRFVGRTPELGTLRQAASRVEQRHGQIVGIIGEAGVGKSRLVYEATWPLQGWLVLSAGGAPYGKNTPYFPLVDLFKSLFHIQDSDTTSEVRERVVRAWPADAGDPDVLVAPMLDLLGVLPLTDAFRDLDPTQRRQRTHDAITQVLLAASIAQPLCLIIEDLHWIDSTTREVLDRFVTSMAAARVLLLVNYRPEYELRWSSKTYYRQIRLDSLSAESTRELLDALLGEDATLAPLKQRLVKRGNPFFLEETARTLVETNALVGERGRYRLTQPVQAIQVPATVQVMLAARIDRLAPEDKSLLEVASVVGTEVPFVVLQSVAELPDETLRRGLDHLQTAEFLDETRMFPDLEYAFKHALTHEVTYGGLLRERRRELHARIVDVIEALHPADRLEQIERLAQHALRGELREKAVHYLRQAGLKAAARSAPLEARAWFEQALGVLPALPESPATLEQGFEIRLELRQMLSQFGEVRLALERLREAEALAEQLNDDRSRGRVCAVLTNAHALLGELDEAVATGTRALEIARRLGDLRLRLLTTTYLEQAHFFRGEYERVIELTTDNLAALPAGSDYESFESTGYIAIYNWFSILTSLTQLGRFAEAAPYEAEALRLAEATNHASTLGEAHVAAGWLHLRKGEWAKARSLIEPGIAAFRTGNNGLNLPRSVAYSAWVLAQVGEASEALTRLREGEQLLEGQAARGIVARHGDSYHSLGRAALLLGRLDEARHLGEQAVESSPVQPGFAAYAMHLLGDIATHPDRFDAESGEAHYRKALALAEPRGMRPLIAQCHLGLGKLYRRTGKREQAQEHLTTATTMYREMDMRFWLEQAEAEM